MYKHNDFEILHLVRENDPDALKLMFDKYTPLIYKTIYKFNLQYELEDMYQEGLLILHTSITKYNEDHTASKSFTKYFQLNLTRKYISIVTKKRRRQEIFEQNIHYIYEQTLPNENALEDSSIYLKEIKKILTKQEFLVYTLRELENFSVQYISKTHDYNEKVIYNTLYRARRKISEHFSN